MATTTASRHPESLNRILLKPLAGAALAALLAAAGLAFAAKAPSASPLAALATVAVLGVTVWMLVNERYEWSLAILMVYLGLVDGYIKLRTGSSSATLLRDVLLYAITAGALVRMAVRRERMAAPPLVGWLIAWTVVVLVQIANPDNGTLFHSLASVRQHAEWLPLFFLGYLTMRSRSRLRAFLLLLLVIATVNGIVGLVQVNLTPEQLSSWGPGYEKAINGEDGVSSRTFADSSGTERVRPFGLGSDFGFGGILGVIAVPAALALLALSRRPALRWASGILAAGVVLAVVTSEARVAVVGAVIALFAFAALTVTSRAGLRTVLGIAATLVVAYVTVGLVFSGSSKGTFERYESISNPTKAVSTAFNYRRNTFAKIPEYAVQYPLGAGFGQAGPAATASGATGHHLDAESEPTFLLIELGLPGLIVMTGFYLALIWLSATRIRKIADRETRILLTGVAAPLLAIFATGFVGITTTSVPSAPYLWFAAGILSFWLLGDGRARLSGRRRAREPLPVPAPA